MFQTRTMGTNEICELWSAEKVLEKSVKQGYIGLKLNSIVNFSCRHQIVTFADVCSSGEVTLLNRYADASSTHPCQALCKMNP